MEAQFAAAGKGLSRSLRKKEQGLLAFCSIILDFAINFQRYAASLKIYDLLSINFGAASLNCPHGANLNESAWTSLAFPVNSRWLIVLDSPTNTALFQSP